MKTAAMTMYGLFHVRPIAWVMWALPSICPKHGADRTFSPRGLWPHDPRRGSRTNRLAPLLDFEIQVVVFVRPRIQEKQHPMPSCK